MLRGLSILLTGCLPILVPAVAVAESVTIVYPPDGAALAHGTIEVIGTVPEGTGEVVFSVSNSKSLKDGKTAAVVNRAFAKVVELKTGAARITISTRDNHIAPASTKVYVTDGQKPAPAGYRTFYRHDDMGSLGPCEQCHRVDRKQMNYRKLKPVSTCATGDCHSDMGQAQFVHGPLGSKVCIHCHNPHGSFLSHSISREGLELCTACHFDSQKFWDKESVHSVVEAGDCIGCHSPHESNTKYQLLGNTSGELCFNCHDQEALIGGDVTHEPVRQLECTLCHDPHSGDFPNMLSETANDVCFSCHAGKREEFAQTIQHQPVVDDCLSCHSVHTENHEYMLSAELGELCIECHREVTPDFIVELEKVSVPHMPVQAGNCTRCHEVHATPFDKLLTAPLDKLCTTCHEEIGERIAAAEYLHGPVEDSECTACHLPHGSTNSRILSTYFPEEFYVPYREEFYEHCFECHNSDLAREATTATLTEFRNGDQNLHYLHVNKDPKGRSCKACHEVHAGPQEKHIRAEVPFGELWSYPITFARTESGGGCIVGCHKPLQYDRIIPVAYDEEG